VSVLGEASGQPPAVEAAEPEPGALAFTGIAAVPLAAAALGLAILGGLLVAVGRRRAGRP
jgi:hypothetical protein